MQIRTSLPIPTLRWTLWAPPALERVGLRRALTEVGVWAGGYRISYAVFSIMVSCIFWCLIITPLILVDYLVISAQVVTLAGETLVNALLVLGAILVVLAKLSKKGLVHVRRS